VLSQLADPHLVGRRRSDIMTSSKGLEPIDADGSMNHKFLAYFFKCMVESPPPLRSKNKITLFIVLYQICENMVPTIVADCLLRSFCTKDVGYL